MAKIEVKRMKDRLREVCQMEKWVFNIRPLLDQSDRYGIWATYKGVYTTAEWQEETIQRKVRSNRSKKAAEVRAARKALREPRDNVSLLRPRPG